MLQHTRRTILTIALLLAPGAISSAQDENNSSGFHGIVLEDNPVHSGAGSNYYAFGELLKGDIVEVVDDIYGWTQIKTSGRAFADFYVLVESQNIRVDRSARAGTTLGRTYLYAPNVSREITLDDSWKSVGRIEVDQRVRILESVAKGDERFYKIAIPDDASAFVPSRAIRRATPDEVRRWNEAPRRPRRIESGPEREAANAEREAEERTPPDPQREPANDVTSTNDTARAANPVEANHARNTPGTAFTQDSNGQRMPADFGTPTSKLREATAARVESEVLGRPEESLEPAKIEQEKPDAELFLESLEASYEAMKKQPIRAAEIEPLRQQYLALASRPDADEVVAAVAGGRAELLRLRAEVQQRLLEIDRLKNRSREVGENAQAAKKAIDSMRPYVAIGRLEASTVYNGDRLPQLLRIVDPGSGRTIGYVEPTGDFDSTTLLGQLVGITGEKKYDDGLRVNLVTPEHIDTLTTAN